MMPTMCARPGRALLLAAVLTAIPCMRVAAQGAGSTGATVLQLLAGGRASALSGAYTGATDDSDVLFYNPAGIAQLAGAAALSYQKHVQDIGVATGSGAFRLGRIVLGASAIFLDYGDITEYVPDPDFGGQTGMPTGNTVSASEVAARLSAAMPLLDDRLNVGASLGYVSIDLAGTGFGTPFVDVGAQYSLPLVTLGASIRHLGGSLSADGIESELPAEARVGAMLKWEAPTGLGAIASADFVAELNSETSGLVAGLEAGLLPGGAGRIGAVGRVGYNAGTGDAGQGALLFGGGLSLGPLSVDYAYQSYELFGTLHRVGVRWHIAL